MTLTLIQGAIMIFVGYWLEKQIESLKAKNKELEARIKNLEQRGRE